MFFFQKTPQDHIERLSNTLLQCHVFQNSHWKERLDNCQTLAAKVRYLFDSASSYLQSSPRLDEVPKIISALEEAQKNIQDPKCQAVFLRTFDTLHSTLFTIEKESAEYIQGDEKFQRAIAISDIQVYLAEILPTLDVEQRMKIYQVAILLTRGIVERDFMQRILQALSLLPSPHLASISSLLAEDFVYENESRLIPTIIRKLEKFCPALQALSPHIKTTLDKNILHWLCRSYSKQTIERCQWVADHASDWIPKNCMKKDTFSILEALCTVRIDQIPSLYLSAKPLLDASLWPAAEIPYLISSLLQESKEQRILICTEMASLLQEDPILAKHPSETLELLRRVGTSSIQDLRKTAKYITDSHTKFVALKRAILSLDDIPSALREQVALCLARTFPPLHTVDYPPILYATAQKIVEEPKIHPIRAFQESCLEKSDALWKTWAFAHDETPELLRSSIEELSFLCNFLLDHGYAIGFYANSLATMSILRSLSWLLPPSSTSSYVFYLDLLDKMQDTWSYPTISLSDTKSYMVRFLPLFSRAPPLVPFAHLPAIDVAIFSDIFSRLEQKKHLIPSHLDYERMKQEMTSSSSKITHWLRLPEEQKDTNAIAPQQVLEIYALAEFVQKASQECGSQDPFSEQENLVLDMGRTLTAPSLYIDTAIHACYTQQILEKKPSSPLGCLLWHLRPFIEKERKTLENIEKSLSFSPWDLSILSAEFDLPHFPSFDPKSPLDPPSTTTKKDLLEHVIQQYPIEELLQRMQKHLQYILDQGDAEASSLKTAIEKLVVPFISTFLPTTHLFPLTTSTLTILLEKIGFFSKN